MKPILFSTPMVQAILDGRKTQTRRVIKPQPIGSKCHGICTISTDKKDIGKVGFGDDCLVNSYAKPRYQSGDILWVREKWLYTDCFGFQNGYMYKANERENKIVFENAGATEKWKPSIHMPRAAARIFLCVTDVRVERVQDITPKDCIAEGLNELAAFRKRYCLKWGCRHDCAALENNCFVGTWDNLNAKRGYGWDANPWVWVYTFERVDNPHMIPIAEIDKIPCNGEGNNNG